MKNNIKKIGNKIILIFSLLSVLGVIFSSVQFRSSIKKVHLGHLQDTVKASAKDQLANTNYHINEMVNDLEQTAKAISKYDNFCHPDIKEILKLSNEISEFDYTAIANAEGNGYDNAGNTFNNAERDYFQTAMQGQVAFSEVIDSKVFDGERVQIIAHPLRTEDEKVRGVVFGVLNIDKLDHIVLQNNQESSSNLYIVDSLGAYIGKFQENRSITPNMNFWSDLEKHELKDVTLSKIKSDFEERKEGEFTYVNEGETYYACYMPIGPNKWQLVYSVSNSSAEKIVHSLYILDTRNAIFGTFCYLGLILCVVWYFKQSNDKIHTAHQEAKKNIEYMHMAMEHSKNTVFEYDPQNMIMRLKTEARNKLFHSTVVMYVPESFISMDLITPDSVPVFNELFETIKTERSCEGDIQIISEGEEIWYRISMNNIYDERDVRIDTVGIVVDISEQKKKEAEMQKKLQIQETLIANALLYAKVDLRTGTVLELNGKEVQFSFNDFIRKSINEKVSDKYVDYVEEKLSLNFLNQSYQQGKEAIEIQFPMKCDNTYKWVACVVYRVCMDEGFTAIFVITDIDTRKRKEIELKERAERDGLTGLYNAATTRSKINEVLSSEDLLKENHVFVLLDLDNFKQINDTFGHSYGDQVLIDVATMLNTRFRSNDIVGRLGGDEFIVLLRNIKSYDYAEYLIEELCKSIHKTYREGDKAVTLSASIGIALVPRDGNTFEKLYRKSDIVQYQVKKQGKNGFMQYQ